MRPKNRTNTSEDRNRQQRISVNESFHRISNASLTSIFISSLSYITAATTAVKETGPRHCATTRRSLLAAVISTPRRPSTTLITSPTCTHRHTPLNHTHGTCCFPYYDGGFRVLFLLIVIVLRLSRHSSNACCC